MAIQFLTTQPADVTPFLAARALALHEAGHDTSIDVNILLATQNPDGGWGTAAGYGSDVPDSAQALQALSAAGVTTPTIVSPALRYLIAAQRRDGGWGLLPGEEGRVYFTALALQALNSQRLAYSLSGIQGRAVEFLHRQQHPDGGYGEPASTPFETAEALRAIFGAGVPLTAAETAALNYLTSQQLPNGSWADDAYSTALALLALTYPIDNDGDGMADTCETTHGLNPNDPADAALDNDSDGLTNLEECRVGTDPNNPDSDSDGGSDQTELQCGSDPLDAADLNRRPVINGEPATVAREGELYVYQINVTDPDGDPLTFALEQAPGGMTISATGLIEWTPAPAQTGRNRVLVQINDGGTCAAYHQFYVNVLAEGIDLTVTSVDITGVDTNMNTLVAIGVVQVEVQNLGASSFNGSFGVRLFEDLDESGAYESDTDNALGSATYNGSIDSNAGATVKVNLSAVVRFRDNLVYAWVDSTDQIPELDESNNLGHSGEGSLYQPPVGEFQPVVEWQWDDPYNSPGVNHPPIVASIIDTNGDGLINERDVPAVIAFGVQGLGVPSYLTALRGDTGDVIFAVPNPGGSGFSGSTTPAVGDLDGDGNPEIVLADNNRTTLYAFNNDGSLKWSTGARNTNAPNAALADLTADGPAESLYFDRIFDAHGTWQASTSSPHYMGVNGGRQIVDLDLDGDAEIVAGASAFDHQGNMLWHWFTPGFPANLSRGVLDGGNVEVTVDSPWNVGDGMTGLANLDDDPYPEIVLITGIIDQPVMWIFEHDGHLYSEPRSFLTNLPQDGEIKLGPPTIADFDGDGASEIAVAATKQHGSPTFDDPTRTILLVVRPDGAVLWQKDTLSDVSLDPPPLTAFDFDGDGAAELVFLDKLLLHIYDGHNGTALFEMGIDRVNDGTTLRYVTIADVDNDGNAELIVPTYASYQAGAPQRRGLLVLGDSFDNWGHSRRIWNQWQYNASQTEEATPLLPYAASRWQENNGHRLQAPLAGRSPFAAPDLSLSKVTFNADACPASAGITARVGNGGNLHVADGIPVNFYLGDPDAGGTLLGTVETTQPLYPGEYEDVTFDWNGPAAGQVFVTVNETVVNPLVTVDNLAQLPHSWAQSSGLQPGGNANWQSFYGIDGDLNSSWWDAVFRNIDPTHYYEVHFPFPVNVTEVTVVNGLTQWGFLSGQLSFSNGTTIPFALNDVFNVIDVPDQTGITWLRLDGTETMPDGAGLTEVIVAGSYREPVFLLNEGTGRYGNNSAVATSSISPCEVTVNRPPQIFSAPLLSAEPGTQYVYQVQASDPNNDPLHYALVVAPSGMNIDDASGLVTWIPSAAQAGPVAVTVEVADGQGGTDQQSYTLTVSFADGNQPPQITSAPPTTAAIGQVYSYSPVAVDPNDDVLVYTLQQAPTGATVDLFSGLISWIPTAGQSGDYFFSLLVEDGRGGTDSQSFIVTIEAANLPLPPLPIDSDGDGFTETSDCVDADSNVNPGMKEIPGNGLDDDCNPATPDTVPSAAVSCSIVTNKRNYGPNSLIQATANIRNESSDLSITGLQARAVIRSMGGQELLSDDITINSLPPNGLYRATVGFSTQTLATNNYMAALQLDFASSVLCQDDAAFGVVAPPDLVVVKSNGQDSVNLGEIVVYNLTVSNLSGFDAIGVVLSDLLPTGTAFVSASDGGVEQDGMVSWPAFNVPAGSDVVRALTVQIADTLPDGIEVITNQAYGVDDGSKGLDPNPLNNLASDEDTVIMSSDEDGDGIEDAIDNCPATPNPDQIDTDGDGQGDACDPDDDNDNVPDGADNCPLLANSEQIDSDSDGQGDVCDLDDDNDGLSDTDEGTLGTDPLDSDSDDDGLSDGDEVDTYGTDPTVPDSDGDGVNDGAEVTAGNDPNNARPTLTVEQAEVSVDEGQLVANRGTMSDAEGDIITLSASVGTVTSEGNGAWSWSFSPSDGPIESQSVTIVASDAGGASEMNFNLIVNNVPPVIEIINVPVEPVNINEQPVSASAEFNDPAGANDEPYSCTVNYGEGDDSPDEPGTVSGTTCTGPSHVYQRSGVYVVTVTVSDKDGASSSMEAAEFIVVYDPSAGYVTGGGWIDSPEGAYIADPLLTGKANFGFVSKYKRGTNVPTGNTEFQFKAGDLNFHSASYDWLVVAGHKAMFKGVGTINGSGNYGFLISAIDEKLTPSTDVDLFRIKIWDKDNEDTIVYDNQVACEDSAEDADPCTLIGGGNIVIHTGTGGSSAAGVEQVFSDSSEYMIFLPLVSRESHEK